MLLAVHHLYRVMDALGKFGEHSRSRVALGYHLEQLLHTDHITPIFKQLHWLPVRYRIVFKILLLVYKALNGTAPSYISELLKYHTSERKLRLSS